MQPIASIQYLRAIAALMVVFGHAQHDAAIWAGKLGTPFAKLHLLPWGAGVDLFFVISGMIMVYASRDLFGRPGAPGLFIKRRLIRIVPLYWLLASAYVLTMALQNLTIGKAWPEPLAMLASYVFIPVDTYATGIPQPFYTLGWTLNYEMFFYVAFAGLILLPPTLAVLTLLWGFILIVLIGAMLSPDLAAPAFWSQPIILEFTLGALIGLALIYGFSLSRTVRALLAGAGIALLMADFLGSSTQPGNWITPNDLARLLAWGLPSAMIVAGVVLGPQRQPVGVAGRAALLLGDASYALYLSHPFVIVLVRKGLIAAGLFESAGGWLAVIAALAFSAALAILIYRLLERPMIRALMRRFAPAGFAPARLSAKPA